MQSIDIKKSHLPAGPIHRHALFTAVGLICDVRLGLVLACELGIMASKADKGAVAVPLLGLTINWITLQAFRKYTYLIVGNWIYLCSDLIVTCIVVTTLPTIFSGGLPLSLAYIIASSVLIGLISQAFWASLWSVGVTVSLALLKLHNTSLPTVVAAATVAGIVFSILIGNRLNSQFTEVSRLSAEAAFARAEERALAERLTIARDLHDSLAKSVHGIRMLAETLHSSLASEHHPDAQLSHLIFESADEASREARLVLDGLRSGGDNDTIGALKEEVNRWSARTGITITTNRAESQHRRLKNAGNPEGLTLDLFIQREAGFISLSILLLVIFTLLGHPVYGILFGVVFSGWMYLWLFQSVQKRQTAIDRDIPDFLDILAITVRSGMSFRSSLERVCSHFDGPVAEEMQKTLHEMRLGVSRRDAFTATKDRCRSDNIDNFVTALLQSEELGTPIGDALASIVKEIRRERAQQVRRTAAKAQPKVALVATTTMVPGAMILMLGGMIFANWETFTKLFGG